MGLFIIIFFSQTDILLDVFNFEENSNSIADNNGGKYEVITIDRPRLIEHTAIEFFLNKL